MRFSRAFRSSRCHGVKSPQNRPFGSSRFIRLLAKKSATRSRSAFECSERTSTTSSHTSKSARAGVGRADAERRDRRADDFTRPPNRKRLRGPRRARHQMRERGRDTGVPGDGVAQKPAAFVRDRVRRADDLHAQRRVSAEFPEDAAAHLETLAVIARQFDQRPRLIGKKPLQPPVHRGRFDRPALRVAQRRPDELDRIIPTVPAEHDIRQRVPVAADCRRNSAI